MPQPCGAPAAPPLRCCQNQKPKWIAPCFFYSGRERTCQAPPNRHPGPPIDDTFGPREAADGSGIARIAAVQGGTGEALRWCEIETLPRRFEKRDGRRRPSITIPPRSEER